MSPHEPTVGELVAVADPVCCLSGDGARPRDVLAGIQGPVVTAAA